jgi:hypothetical protein
MELFSVPKAGYRRCCRHEVTDRLLVRRPRRGIILIATQTDMAGPKL